MKLFVVACLVALSAAAPQKLERDAQILKDVRVQNEHIGAYSTDVETENGIFISESGQSGDAGAVNSQGEVAFPLPNGETFVLKFVANENGYQPESDFLPVAPAFPHPIPQFVLEQIRFAEEQRAARGGNQDFN